MSDAGEFTIVEFDGGGNEGESFVWTAHAHSIPKQPWSFPLSVTTVSTKYPGGTRKTEQVMGPDWDDFTLEGKWDDRYNVRGFAVAEMRRFENMVRRGNICRFQYQEQAFLGLVKNFEPMYRRDWDIDYKFTVSNHGRPDQDDDAPPTAPLLTPDRAFDDANLKADAVAQLHPNNQGPAVQDPLPMMSGDVLAGVTASLDSISARMDDLGQMLDTRRGTLKPIGDFKRIATMFRQVGSDAVALTDHTVTVRSDTELAVRTAMSVLNFEAWTRSLRENLRLLRGSTAKGARDCEDREDPAPLTFYQPFAGESLYSVARRFYNTPHAWRIIADRNHITTMRLTGDERLVIPEL